MRIVLAVIAVIVAIIVIVPEFIDADVTITRTIEVNKPVDQVYNVVKDFNYYKQWNAWSQMDKDATGEISGPVGEVGSSWSWNGDTIGIGTLTIEALVPNQSITNRMEFFTPMAGEAQGLWNFDMIDSAVTKITWTYAGTTDSYFMRYMNPMMEGMLGPQLETGLNNLKTLIETLPDPEPEIVTEEMTEKE